MPVHVSDVLFWHLASAADDAGHLHVIGATRLPGRGLFYLTNASGTWTEEEITQPAAEGTDDDPTIGIDAEGRIWVTFRRWSIYEECGLGCSRDPSRIEDRYVTAHTDGGWLKPVSFGLAKYRNDLSLVLDEDAVVGGTFEAAYVVAVHGTPQVRYATNDSGEWQDTFVAEGYDPDLAIGSDGEPRIALDTANGATSGLLAARVDGEWEIDSIRMGEDFDFDVETLLVDSIDQPVVVFSRFEEDAGYRSYLWVRESFDNMGEYPLADCIVEQAYVGPADLGVTDSVHGLCSVFDTEARDGIWYARVLDGIESMTRISDSVRVVADGFDAAQTLVGDANGTPHVFYATPYDDVEALMYAVGPTP